MKKRSLVIMVGGMSSRMKQSIRSAERSNTVTSIALQQHKSLIPLGKEGKPMLYYLLKNAKSAGITNIYLITSVDNLGFKDFIQHVTSEEGFKHMIIKLAIQHVPEEMLKPQGTADALLQCLDQYPELLNEEFIVCNGDNLYSARSMKVLMDERTAPHALIAYDRSGLRFPDAKIARFAILAITKEGFLSDIVEKPEERHMDSFRDTAGKLRVSMNIFSFNGSGIYPYLKGCKPHPLRLEKELPEAVRNLIRNEPNGILCIPYSEHVPDLTSAGDLSDFK